MRAPPCLFTVRAREHKWRHEHGPIGAHGGRVSQLERSPRLACAVRSQ